MAPVSGSKLQALTPPAVADLLGRDFTATAPDQRWCGDITYLRVGDRFLYHHRRWNSAADARRDIFRWIAFNNRRRHSALGYRSPAEYERTLDPTTLLPIAA
jgi:transposase InsO family protein